VILFCLGLGICCPLACFLIGARMTPRRFRRRYWLYPVAFYASALPWLGLHFAGVLEFGCYLFFMGFPLGPLIGMHLLVLSGSMPRHPAGHCQRCGYNLTGNTSGICPECGTPVDKAAASKLGA
jgi:hypothetical protein